ncbi:retrotransposon protein, putative, ty1-copia subclass [Tanacetum coccineum]
MLRAHLILRFFVRSIGVTVNYGMSLQFNATQPRTRVVGLAALVRPQGHSNPMAITVHWIVLSIEDKLPFLEQPIPALPVPPQGRANPPDVVTTHQASGAYQELLQTVREFHACKQEGQSVSSYVLKMKSYIDNWERLGHAMTQNLSVSPKEGIRSGSPEKKLPHISHRVDEKEEAISRSWHFRYIFTIELYSFPSTSWVYDTGCGTHICITTQGLRGSKKLKPGALSLYVGDGHRAAVEAIGDFHLCLPSGFVLILHNCHYAPSVTRGVISVSRLYKDGFVNRFEDDNSISVFKNNMIYFNAIPRDDIYEIVMSSSNTNECSMYAFTNKRAKLNLDSALLWHCRLGHINKKRIEKLQHDGLLDSTDIKSFERCVACMCGKMARKPYSHQVERAKDLLRTNPHRCMWFI